MVVRRADDVLARKLRTCALAVVRNDHAVHALVQLLVNVGKILLSVVAVDRARILKVEAQHLLMPADDADLRRGRTLRTDKPRVIDAACSKFLEETFAVCVVADIARNADIRPEKREVVRNVCRAAESLARARYVRNRHGCLGRDARDLTRIVFVKHDIADDEDVAAPTLLRDRCADLCHIHENAPICYGNHQKISVKSMCFEPCGQNGTDNTSRCPPRCKGK